MPDVDIRGNIQNPRSKREDWAHSGFSLKHLDAMKLVWNGGGKTALIQGPDLTSKHPLPRSHLEKGKSMSANHFQILANSEAWVVTLSGKHLATCRSRAEAYDIACKRAEELGSGEIFVHDATGELEFHENVNTPRRETR
ncbi:hypothetical protein GCM10010038_30290 [Glutamicibacter protophormiae]|nr:hypothetical protein GCM10010038_30290 [Glutamicibacter protophormiae]